MRELTTDDGVHAVYGGAVLGGGGGGHIDDGLSAVEAIASTGATPVLAHPTELDSQATVAAVALVGAPSAPAARVTRDQDVGSVAQLAAEVPGGLHALMTNENGASTTVNGWFQAAELGLPILDCPANGRAHPTATMGSMNLHADGAYPSIQSFAGGAGPRAISGVLRGRLPDVSSLVRSASVAAGGLVAVCRNPIPVGYAARHGAPGAITTAIELGQAMAREAGPGKIEAAAAFLGGRIAGTGKATGVTLRREGGFDVGSLAVGDLELTMWNEYMTLERAGARLATFPSLIMTFDARTGEPVVSARVREGMDLAVLVVPARRLTLSVTMRDRDLLATIEPVIGRDIASHLEAPATPA